MELLFADSHTSSTPAKNTHFENIGIMRIVCNDMILCLVSFFEIMPIC